MSFLQKLSKYLCFPALLAAGMMLFQPTASAEYVAMNYGADGNDYLQFTTPSMAFDKASRFTTLITFGIHVNTDGTLTIGGNTCVSNGIYVGPSNWGSLVNTLKTPPTTVKRYEVLVGGWLDTSYDSIKSLVNTQGTGPNSILYKNFQALKNAVPGIDAINDDDEFTYDVASSTSFANLLGGLGYHFTLAPYTRQSFWVQLRNNITNCDYVYLQCYSGGAGNDPGNWNAAFGGTNGFSLSGFHVIPGQESNTASPTNWTNWYLETGVQGGFYFPDVVFNTTNWSAAILNAVGQNPPITLTNNDIFGSSFNAAGNWSDENTPATTNAYVDSGFILNTPATGQQTFSGGSLLLNNAARLSLKNNGNITTFGTNAATGLTVDYNASVVAGMANGNSTLAGYLNLGPDGGGNFDASNGVLNITASISGSGQFELPAATGGVVALSGVNHFTGSAIVNSGATLRLQNPQALSAGSLALNNGSTLQLCSDNSATFPGSDNLQGLGHANVTMSVDQLTSSGAAQALGFALGGFNVGDTTLNFTGGHGYSLVIGSLAGAFANPLSLNATTANVQVGPILGGANITQLNKNGSGTVSLSGASSYTGGTFVNAGALEFQSGASGVSSQLQVAGGAICRVLSTLPIVNPSATITINTGGNLFLTGGENLGVSALILGGVAQTTGSWGSSQSPAQNHNDSFFSGTGVLWVDVPPPAPAPPTVLTATPGAGSATLYWNNGIGATSYHVKRGSSTANLATIATVSGTSYVDTSLTNGIVSYYAISGLNASGESSNSASVVVTPNPVVKLTASDAFNVSSFNSGANWSDAQSPSAAKNYLCQTNTLRTPNSGSFVFAGGSLLVSGNGVLALKTGTGSTITVGNSPLSALTLDNGLVSIFDSGRTETLAGYITLNPGGGSFTPNTGTLPVSSEIGGVGTLKIVGNANPPAIQNGMVILSGNNTYGGGTTLDTANTLRLSGAGTLGAATGAFTFSDSGNLSGVETLDLNGTSQNIGNLSGIRTARILNNAMFTASTFTIGNGDGSGGIFSGVISNGAGSVTLVKVGAGTITLTGSNTFSGTTTVSAGTLALAGTGSIDASKKISLAQGAVLDISARTDQTLTLFSGNTLLGSGTINGNLNLITGATVTPGDVSTGTLTVQSNISLAGSLLLKLNRTATPSSDQLISLTGIITGGGSLTISNIGAALQADDTFRLFNQPVSGFTAPNLPSGYLWANHLAVDGTIQVTSVISTSQVRLGVQISGNNLLLQWPADHTGWNLQSCTNLLNPNWMNVANANATNQMIIPNLSSNACQFFRLEYP